MAAGKLVTFRHDVDDRELVDAYRRALCLVLPSVYRTSDGSETKVPELLGQTLAIGDARLKVVKRITRCAAVNVDPETAARDLSIPQALMRRLGHADFGLYAEVIRGGEIGVGDKVAVEDPTGHGGDR